MSGLGTTQDTTQLHAAAVAETYTGGHITMGVSKDSSSIKGQFIVIIFVLPEGISTPSLNVGDNQDILQPEEYVLWSRAFHFGDVADGEYAISISDRIKTQRKLKVGDRISIAGLASVASLANVYCAITSFYKQ